MPSGRPSLYRRVVKVTHIYLGPAADRFISRQVQNHLNKDPEELSNADLIVLLGWIRGAISMLTEDSVLVEEYINQLEKLTRKPDTSHGKN
jgi:hypothetical protein